MKNEEREQIEARIRDLVSKLDASTSPYGDWKVIKCYEAKLLNEESPYDIDELMTARQAIRDEINELQTKLEELEEE